MIQVITKKQLNEVIKNRDDEKHMNKYVYIKNQHTYICCDNTTSEAKIIELSSLSQAVKWLNDYKTSRGA